MLLTNAYNKEEYNMSKASRDKKKPKDNGGNQNQSNNTKKRIPRSKHRQKISDTITASTSIVDAVVLCTTIV